MTLSKTLAEALSNFERDFVMEAIKNRLDQGEDPMHLVLELQEGMNLVGERYSKGNYFLSELIMSSNLFSLAMELIEPRIKGVVREALGKIVIGTAKGDIHDIGKNLVAMMLEGAGFEVIDLGVDVAPERFIDRALQEKADIIAMSALLTTTMESMRDLVHLMEARKVSSFKVLIGGAPVDGEFCQEIGADAHGIDARDAVRKARELLGLS